MPKGTALFTASADFMAPGALEINRYQTEILDMVRRRLPFGQRIQNTPATGQPSRWFEQTSIPTGGFTDPRAITMTTGQPVRQERVVTLKALTAGINYSLFDTEITQQQGQFTYLEAKDLSDTVDGILKLHDQALWTGADTDLLVQTSPEYFGCSGQLIAGASETNGNPIKIVSATGSLVDGYTDAVALLANRTDFEVRPTAIYGNPILMNLIAKEAKASQNFYNQVEVIPGVVVTAIPTQMGNLPLIGDPAIKSFPAASGQMTHTSFIISEDMIEYHYLTDMMPRVFQLGLQGNLAAQYTVVKFGAPVVKGRAYAHIVLQTTR